MSDSEFRKGEERVASPDKLNDYIKVANPGIRLALAAIVLLLLGAIVWGSFGKLDSVVEGVATVTGTDAVLYVSEADGAKIRSGQIARVDGRELTVSAVSARPVAVDESFDPYLLHVGGFQLGDWVYAVSLEGDAAEGIFAGEIVVERVSPIRFVIN